MDDKKTELKDVGETTVIPTGETETVLDETVAMAAPVAGEATADETTVLDTANADTDMDADEPTGVYDPETHDRMPAGEFKKQPLDDNTADGDDGVMPPSIPPADNTDGDESDDESKKPSNRKRNIIIAASIIAILALAGVGGGYAYADMQVQKGMQAAQAYAQQVDWQLNDKITEAQTLIDDTKPEQVADPAVLDTLTDTIESAGKQKGVATTDSNPYLLWTLMDAQHAYDTDTADAQTSIKQLTAQISNVNQSIDQKTHDTAKASLQTTLDSARKTLTDTDGKVADNKTRETLTKTIDAAQKILDADDSTAKNYNEQKTALDNAVKAVNDSKTAKDKADAEAKAQAEAASSASTGGGSYTGGGYTGGGYSGGGYTGGGSYSGGGYNNYYGSGSTGGNYGGSSSGGSGLIVGDSVVDGGGQWFGGQMQNGVMGYTESGLPITPFDPSTPNSWTTGPMHIG